MKQIEAMRDGDTGSMLYQKKDADLKISGAVVKVFTGRFSAADAEVFDWWVAARPPSLFRRAGSWKGPCTVHEWIWPSMVSACSVKPLADVR